MPGFREETPMKRNPQEIPLEIIQNGEFRILQYIKDVCDRNGLKYFLAYGTLIGAVRHQGFIPWDDDMDIHMPREDYLKFAEIVKRDPHPYYRLISRETSPKFTHLLSKVIDTRTHLTQKTPWSEKVQLGIYVDIFILDGAGNTRVEAEATYLAALSCYRQWQKAVHVMLPPGKDKKDSIKRWLRHIPYRLLGVRYFMDKHTDLCTLKSYYQYRYVGAMSAGTGNPTRNVWLRKWFGEGTDVTFNGEMFRAPQNWDAVLRPEYGDYMELPPPEKRHSTHRYVLKIPDPAVLRELSSKPE